VVLSGGGSTDPDGDPLIYTWTGPFGTLAGETVEVTLPLGTTPVALTVDDNRGGIENISINVTVSDTTAPLLTLNDPNPLIIECGTMFVDPGATAFDAVLGNLTGAIQVTGHVDPNALGSYTLTYTVSDGSNHTQKQRTVLVVDTTPRRCRR
jgi:hypothetical protein